MVYTRVVILLLITSGCLAQDQYGSQQYDPQQEMNYQNYRPTQNEGPSRRYSNQQRQNYGSSQQYYQPQTNQYQRPSNQQQRPSNQYQRPSNQHQRPSNQYQQQLNQYQQSSNQYQEPLNQYQPSTSQYYQPPQNQNQQQQYQRPPPELYQEVPPRRHSEPYAQQREQGYRPQHQNGHESVGSPSPSQYQADYQSYEVYQVPGSRYPPRQRPRADLSDYETPGQPGTYYYVPIAVDIPSSSSSSYAVPQPAGFRTQENVDEYVIPVSQAAKQAQPIPSTLSKPPYVYVPSIPTPGSPFAQPQPENVSGKRKYTIQDVPRADGSMQHILVPLNAPVTQLSDEDIEIAAANFVLKYEELMKEKTPKGRGDLNLQAVQLLAEQYMSTTRSPSLKASQDESELVVVNATQYEIPGGIMPREPISNDELLKVVWEGQKHIMYRQAGQEQFKVLASFPYNTITDDKPDVLQDVTNNKDNHEETIA